ncbi:hypothetical protein F5H01DRAFT_384260 [Linnemannia elongata]|nr:hypothetical protein F5H01DRAFT_384260 [Linnemannia elongata]
MSKMSPIHPLDLHEIRSRIANFLILRDVANCARVSQDWNDSFTPLLYKSVVLSRCGPSIESVEKNKYHIKRLKVHCSAYKKMLSASARDKLVFSVMANSPLTTLDMSKNSIGLTGAQVLSEALKINSTLTTLNLWCNSIKGNGAEALSEALKTNSTLTALNLTDNYIGPNGSQALSEALKTNSTLTTLNLCRNSIGPNGAQALSEALKTNSTLTTLNLAGNTIGPHGAEALAGVLKTNPTLTTLNLGINSIGPNGAQALSKALKSNSTLITLNLSWNSIEGDGAQALYGALKTNSTLITLNLRSNYIRYNGALALSEALKTNSSLTTLNLSWNSIGPNGAEALSEALKTNSTLTALNLTDNYIGPNGSQALSEALKTNSTLTTLNLCRNSIGSNGAQALSEALKTNSTVTVLVTRTQGLQTLHQVQAGGQPAPFFKKDRKCMIYHLCERHETIEAMPVRTHARTVTNTNASASASARVPFAVRLSSSFKLTFRLATYFLLLLLLSTLLAHPVIAAVANRIQDSTGHPVTPTTRYGEEYLVTLSLFESATLNATACYKFYYTNPPLLAASENRLWLFATVPLRSFENNNRGICGRCLKIRTIDGQFEVPVKVAGDCPGCVSDQIEVSGNAFQRLGAWQEVEGVNWPWIPDRQF